MQSHYANHKARYNDSWAYFPVFFDYYHEEADPEELDKLNLAVDNSGNWDFESAGTSPDTQSSWADGISFSDGGDGGASCGSSCGGGCGGS